MILIESKRKKPENILKRYPSAILADVTSSAKDGLVKLSPFYPHGGIPVPFSEGYTAMCVEAIWQGLKVFESCDIDVSLFDNVTMRNISSSGYANCRRPKQSSCSTTTPMPTSRMPPNRSPTLRSSKPTSRASTLMAKRWHKICKNLNSQLYSPTIKKNL